MKPSSTLSLLPALLSAGLASACSSDDPPACVQAQTTFEIASAPAEGGAAPIVVSELQDDALALSFAPTYAGQPLVWFEESAVGEFELTVDFADFVAAGPGASFRLIVSGTSDGPHVLSLVETAAGLEARVLSPSGLSDLVDLVDDNAGRFFVRRSADNELFLGVRAGTFSLGTRGEPNNPAITVRAELASDATATLPAATSIRLLDWKATGAMVADPLECSAE